MKSYTRVEPRAGYVIITDVDNKNRYYQRCVWDDGMITNQMRTTLDKMGWNSLDEFLRSPAGKCFTLTGC